MPLIPRIFADPPASFKRRFGSLIVEELSTQRREPRLLSGQDDLRRQLRGHAVGNADARCSAQENEFKTGVETFGPGDAWFIPAGAAHAHRAVPLSATVVALFVKGVEPAQAADLTRP